MLLEEIFSPVLSTLFALCVLATIFLDKIICAAISLAEKPSSFPAFFADGKR